MPRLPAKALQPTDVRRLLALVDAQRHPLRNALIVQLSFKAGLRACEIAGLSWPMVLTGTGHIADQITIAGTIAKGGRGRRIPMHADIRRLVRLLHRQAGRPRDGPVIRSERGAPMTPRSIVNWFAHRYRELGLAGCSSHSGRRTFITTAARLLTRTGGSLRDVQGLAGHRSLTTTERYIEGDREAQRKLIARL